MVRSSYITILSSMGDDVPILGAVVTLFAGKGLLLFLLMLIYISMGISSCIIIASGMGDDVSSSGAVVTLLRHSYIVTTDFLQSCNRQIYID